MKNDVMHASAQVDRFIIENLKEVQETLAQLESKRSKAKTFGVSDLWNIRRKSRTASSMLRHLGA